MASERWLCPPPDSSRRNDSGVILKIKTAVAVYDDTPNSLIPGGGGSNGLVASVTNNHTEAQSFTVTAVVEESDH